MSDFEKTDRSEVRRIPQRGTYDTETIHAIIDEALICHVGMASEHGPRVIPMFHARIDTTLYLHGSRASGLLNSLAGGGDVCVTFTLLDGLVLARSMLHHSMNYRSVVMFGKGREVTDPNEKNTALLAFADHAVPGRSRESRPPSDQEFEATAVVAIPITEASAKIRTGPPSDDEKDLSLNHWAGLIPIRTVASPPEPAPDLVDGIALPESIRQFTESLR